MLFFSALSDAFDSHRFLPSPVTVSLQHSFEMLQMSHGEENVHHDIVYHHHELQEHITVLKKLLKNLKLAVFLAI